MAWYPVHPSERWLHLLPALSFSLGPRPLAATQLFLNLLTDSPYVKSLSGEGQRNLRSFISSRLPALPRPPHFEPHSEWWLAVAVH